MKLALLALMLVACGKDSVAIDAPVADTASSIDAPAQLSCAAYCTKIASACTGANVQFAGTAECMATCAKYPVGTMADTSGNTLGCHFYHAGNAVSGPAVHCIHAGPSGGGGCGTSCVDFCSLVTAVCPTQYPAVNSCMTQCANFMTAPPYSSMMQTGNTFACRMYHATAASVNSTTHCPHTAPTATAPCT